MLTVLEYALVRLALGAVRLAFRALELVALATLWALGVVFRFVFRLLARALRRPLGHWQLAAARRTAATGRR